MRDTRAKFVKPESCRNLEIIRKFQQICPANKIFCRFNMGCTQVKLNFIGKRKAIFYLHTSHWVAEGKAYYGDAEQFLKWYETEAKKWK